MKSEGEAERDAPAPTERLVLRAPAPSDVEPFAALVGDPEVMRHVGDGRPLTREEAGRRLKAPGRAWSVLRRSDGAFVGFAWLNDELGFLVRRQDWGQGLASEVARALVEHGLGELGLERVRASVDEDRAASIRVLEKAGLTLERDGFDEQGRYLVYCVERSIER